jgi:hypothetical protein
MKTLCKGMCNATWKYFFINACLVVVCFVLTVPTTKAQDQQADQLTVDLVRRLSKELFDSNSQPFMQPLIESINATSNARFYNHARIPKENKFYWRFGLHGMYGGIQNDQKIYKPSIPRDSVPEAIDATYLERINREYGVSVNFIPSPGFSGDTVGLITYLFKTIIDDQIKRGGIETPEQSATVVGNDNQALTLPNSAQIKQSLEAKPIYTLLSPEQQAQIDSLINNLTVPPSLDLPTGGNLSAIFMAVPQFEFGSWYGTEFLVRFIPVLDYGDVVGKFGFWGLGVKHSISQYFQREVFDLAVQLVYQGTTMENFVGVTNAKLEADATILNANIHASKQFNNFDIYTGLSYEGINTEGTYTYTLPRSLQSDLGLITWIDANGDNVRQDDEYVPDPENGFPGDTQPQVSNIALDNTNFKWTLGASAAFGNLSIFADYSISNFNVFSAGMSYQM